MIYLGAILALTQFGTPTNGPKAWYGPVTVSLPLSFTGNPYDPAENDVEVDFVRNANSKIRRMGYYIGDGKFAATLVTPIPGLYRAQFILNGQVQATIDEPVAVTAKLPHGYIGLKGRHFAWSDGTPYFPIGYDYAWRGVPNETVAQGMAKMGKSGANWSRIWADHWDDKNPFWPSAGHAVPPRQLRQDSLELWDGIVKAAEDAGVSFQMTLFHHGPYSTTTDSNWRDHPWNTANGGFLSDPTDFFVNKEAKRRTKIWLRYAVARYAHSPAIMAWELFNEVQWVDAIKKNPARVRDVAAWHAEMALYIRLLDPYHHPVTSSSSESLDSHVFDTVDYLQPHTYPANVLAAIGGYEFTGKPGFFGEFGPPTGPNQDYRKLVRDGIYGGILAGHAGAGMYWFWDRVDREGLAADYLAARKVIDASGLLRHLDAKPLKVWAETPGRADMTLSAGLGWGPSTVSEFDLPRVSPRELAGWSQYFQSLDGGKKAWAKPVIFTFVAKTPGKMLLNVGGVSSGGGTLAAWVNDKPVLDQKVLSTPRTPIAVEYPAGKVTVRLENHGADWIRLDSVTVPDQAPTAFAQALGDRSWALIRIFGRDTSNVTIEGLGLPDGRYAAAALDLVGGTSSLAEVEIKNGAFNAAGLSSDCVIDLSRTRSR